MANVQVLYIIGTDRRSGVQMDLAKFFSKKDAEAHLDRFAAWHNPRVDARTESLDAQHEAHREGLLRGAVDVPFVQSAKSRAK